MLPAHRSSPGSGSPSPLLPQNALHTEACWASSCVIGSAVQMSTSPRSSHLQSLPLSFLPIQTLSPFYFLLHTSPFLKLQGPSLAWAPSKAAFLILYSFILKKNRPPQPALAWPTRLCELQAPQNLSPSVHRAQAQAALGTSCACLWQEDRLSTAPAGLF